MFKKITIIFCLFFSLQAHSKQEIITITDDVYLLKSTFEDLYNWENEDYKEALKIFLDSCKKIKSLPKDKNLFPQINSKINKNDFYAVCKIANIIKNYNHKYLQVFFESYFIPYRIVDIKHNSLFTGYYLPQINAKRTKDDIFKYPIYRKAEDFENNGKYYTRQEINDGILNDRNLEILYTDDLVELFFFHIQGSGSVYLVDENKIIFIGYDGKNDYNFTSIGKYMLNNALIDEEKINAKDIKTELKKNMELAKFVMNKNESYIFFKILEDNVVTGSFGTQLIPFRTIAVDTRYIPLGFPLWLNTRHTQKDRIEEFSKLVIANDTGSAIKGGIRGDIFFGSGIDGENNASYQHSEGEYFLLIPTRVVRKL